MRVKIDGFVTKAVLHNVVEQLFERYENDIDMMTGVNIYFTPRGSDGAELVIHGENGLPIELMKLNVKPKRSIDQPRKPVKKTPTLVSIAGGKVA